MKNSQLFHTFNLRFGVFLVVSTELYSILVENVLKYWLLPLVAGLLTGVYRVLLSN